MIYVEEMACYTKPQQRKKEKSEQLRGERDQIKLFILDLSNGKFLDSGKQDKGKTFHKLYVLGMNDDLCDDLCEFVHYAVKLGKGVNELSFWWS